MPLMPRWSTSNWKSSIACSLVRYAARVESQAGHCWGRSLTSGTLSVVPFQDIDPRLNRPLFTIGVLLVVYLVLGAALVAGIAYLVLA